jgi:hypothetical protein
MGRQEGQILPILIILVASLLGLGIYLLQVGRAGQLRAGAQTAADAAALAAAKEVGKGYAANEYPQQVDDAAARSQAEEYADRNDAVLVDYERQDLDVLVSVATKDSIGEGGELVDSADVKAEAKARARVDPIAAIAGPGGAMGGALGAPTEGVASDVKDAIKLAEGMGLTVTSTTGGQHAPGSFHYSGKAVDVAGPPDKMRRYFLAAEERYGSNILEMFYDGNPYYVDSGKRVQGRFGGHGDHVHIALNGKGPTGGGKGSDPGDDGPPRATSASGGGGGGRTGDAPRTSADRKSSSTKVSKVGVGECGGAVLKTVYAVGVKYKATDKEMLSAFETALVESNACNIEGGDRDSLGVFQQRPSQGWGSRSQILDVSYAAGKYFAGVKRGSQGGTAGQLAQSVQRSAFPGRYDEKAAQAKRLIEQIGNGELPIIEGLPGGVGASPLAAGSEVRLVPYDDGG